VPPERPQGSLDRVSTARIAAVRPLAAPAATETDRTGVTKEALRRAFLDNLYYVQGKFPTLASKHDYYMALASTVRDRLLQRWISTAATYTREGSRTVAYLSAEFLLGPHLGNNLINLDIEEPVRAAIRDLGLSYEELLGMEEEPGLGNGGLGRLAACYLDSMATLEIPAIGYGIRYEFGIFAQRIVDGWQVEQTDKWLRRGNPWELARPEWSVEVKLGGHVERFVDLQGRAQVRWVPGRTVVGVPYDTPILGYRNRTANTLRLWRAEAPEAFDLSIFNRGDYYGAVQQKVVSENISKILYPNDEQIQGKELRLEQQYFFVSCSLQDMIRIMRVQGIAVDRFHEKFAVQLNDTHPAVAIAELMRLLVDEHGMDWDHAWSVTRRTFGYTNHTLLPEALERWPLALFARVLPRHMEIIFEINTRFLDEVRMAFPGDGERLARLSLIDESGERYVRMAHLACVGSHAINGVAALHSELLKQDVLADFHALWPGRVTNVTNGVTPRRWMVLSNPRLTRFLRATIGDEWISNLDELERIAPGAEDPGFRREWRFIKRCVKEDFTRHVRRATGVAIDPHSLFDVQVKRIHEYKRQHLNVLHVVALYLRLKFDPHADFHPRTFVFGGKAAPGYHFAKLMIKLITAVGEVVNKDRTVNDRLKLVFLPNYNVTNGQRVYPAADLSEQISTAGKEASGTGNMKFSMNGALTIGTLDGANVEIREAVGAENFFLFGLTAAQVQASGQPGAYDPMAVYRSNEELRAVIDLVAEGHFSRGDRELFRPLIDSLLVSDRYRVLADFASYVECQERVSAAYADRERWTRMSIHNVARMGRFSSDRSIRDYCRDIWNVEPTPIELLSEDEVTRGLLQ
jgi:starch phosphorylase